MRAISLVALACFLAGAVQEDGTELGKVVPNFKLKTPDGKKEIELKQFRSTEEKKGDIVVLYYWSYKCPAGNRAMDAAGDLAEFCRKKKVVFLGLCAYGESAGQIEEYRKENEIGYTLLMDLDGKASGVLDAQVVTESFILDRDGTLLYRGAFQKRRKFPLKDALEEVLEGKEVTVKETRPSG